MSDLVDPDDIERIVGVPRHPTIHYGRAVTVEQIVYVLHSQECKDSGIDLRDCLYSYALDLGIEPMKWAGQEDQPVPLDIKVRLVPKGVGDGS